MCRARALFGRGLNWLGWLAIAPYLVWYGMAELYMLSLKDLSLSQRTSALPDGRASTEPRE